MKLSVAVISAALAAREPDAERRLEKINEKARELIDYANDSSASEKQKAALERRINRLLGQLDKIDTSACPAAGVDEDRFTADDEFDGLCDGSGKIPSMMRSYARKFGCEAGFPKKNFLDKIIDKSHKLKLRARKAGKCPGGDPAPVDPTSGPTGTPVTNPPIADLCGENKWADCYDLTSGEIYFENQWTCRNCFRVKATYGQNTNFNAQFNAARGDFVSIKFTEPVVWQTWNHPVSGITEVGDDNVWKVDFKADGNFMSGMIFEGNLQTSDDALFVDGNWIIDSAQQCRCRKGERPTVPPTTTPTPTPTTTTEPSVVCEDPCDGRDNCDMLVNSCPITPEWSNIIGTVDGDAIYTASVDVFCKKSSGHSWQSVVHMTRGTSRDQFGDRYFTVWQHADGRLKLNGPMKGNDFDEVEYWVDCEDQTWTTISISQQEIEGNMLELTMFQDGEALGSNVVNPLNAYSGPITVYASNPYHPPATLFKVRNFWHTSEPYVAPPCVPVDPCLGLDSCETYINNCMVAPFAGNQIATTTGFEQFRISAEVRCTDRAAPTWENVLHVNTGTSRQNFGDRYFTIWKKHAPNTNQIRIVAPVFDNAHHELNAYVDCEEGWHSFAVQQTEFDNRQMNVEILFDGDVVESQLVQKQDVFNGSLNVEVASNFGWPAASDHYVRNFIHQDLTCPNPCDGEDNCETFVDACEINPSTGNLISTIDATVNFKASIDILCSHDMELGAWKNIFHMSGGGENGNPGDRFFAAWRQPNHHRLHFALGVPEGSFAQYKVIDCVDGRWNTFSLEQRQDPDAPHMVKLIFSKNDNELASYNYESAAVFTGPIDVFSARDHHDAASDFSVRNFFYQTFDDTPQRSCDEESAVDPCDELEDCTTFVDSCAVNPQRENNVGSIEATKNFRSSIDIQCNHNMDFGSWQNIFHMSAGGENGNPGDRFFAAWRRPSDHRLHFALGVPEGSYAQYKTFDCVDGEWNTYVLEQKQDPEAPAVASLTFTMDGDVLASYNYESDAVLVDSNIDAFVSREDSVNNVAFKFQVRNFFHQTFADVVPEPCVGADPCDGETDCVTFVDSCSANPAASNNVGTIEATKNFKTSIEIQCNHNMAFGSWRNIFHMSGGGENGNPGDRFFAAWRRPNDHKLHFALGVPVGSFAQYKTLDCVDGEWNTYVLEQRQDSRAPGMATIAFSMDGAELASYDYASDDVLVNIDIDAFTSRETSINKVAFKSQVRNFFHQSFDDVTEEECVGRTDPCDGQSSCTTFVDSCAANPSSANNLGTIEATKNFRTSIDIQCNHNMAFGSWRNIFHMSGGGENGNPGDRFFAAWRRPNDHRMHFALGVPVGSFAQYKIFDCVDGEWNTYVLEQRQEGETAILKFTMDGTELASYNYPADDVLVETNIDAFSSRESDPNKIAWQFGVRNFFHQDLSCSDPCEGKASCTTLVNGCAVAPVFNNQIATVEATVNYKYSAEIFCAHNMPLSTTDEWFNIIHVTAGGDLGGLGDRTFTMARMPASNTMYMTVTDPTRPWNHKWTTISCTQGEWNTYSVEVRQNEDDSSMLVYQMKKDETLIHESTFQVSRGKTSGPLQVFTSNPFDGVATEYSLRNFYYQTFETV